MSSKWEGFTEDDIKNLNKTKKFHIADRNNCVPQPVNKQKPNIKKNVKRERMLQTTKNSNLTKLNEIPKEARLFNTQIPEEEEDYEIILSNQKSVVLETVAKTNLETEIDSECKQELNTKDVVESNENNIPTIEPILTSSKTDMNTLEEFEKKQNRIKEQNRIRKEILKKALEDRTKKTLAETQRLHQIEGELKKLDDQLITDVAILRDQIEISSLEFMEAQKRFDLCEREYLEAKLNLFNKKERKELLTNHLCMIIEHNELRKAKKLSELIEKLEYGNPSSNFLVSKLSNDEVVLSNNVISNDNITESKEVLPTKEEKCRSDKD